MHPVLERVADGFQHVLARPVVTIGRDPASAIEVPLVAVSRQHATVSRTDHGHVLRDLESRNGTFVNGVRATSEPVLRRDGDDVVIAGVETLRYVDPLATPSAPAVGRLSGVWIDPATDDRSRRTASPPAAPLSSARRLAHQVALGPSTPSQNRST